MNLGLLLLILSLITLGRTDYDFECDFDDRTLEGVAEDDHHGEHAQDRAALNTHKKRKVTWPVYKGQIIFVPTIIDRNIPDVSRRIIREVFSVMERKIRCLGFLEIRKPPPVGYRYLKINVQGDCLTPEMTSSGTCWTESGYSEILMRQKACEGASKGILDHWHKVFQHEMFHAFGIAHMQTRSDREKYIKVNYFNIKPEKFGNYDKCTACSLSKTPYDCQSIMHYPSHHNAKDPSKPTITPVDRSSCKLSKDMRTKKATKHDWDSLREMLLLMHPLKICGGGIARGRGLAFKPPRDQQYNDVKNNKTLDINIFF